MTRPLVDGRGAYERELLKPGHVAGEYQLEDAMTPDPTPEPEPTPGDDDGSTTEPES